MQINDGSSVRVDVIEAFRKKLDTAQFGDNVGLLFKKLTKSDLDAGDVIDLLASSWHKTEDQVPHSTPTRT